MKRNVVVVIPAYNEEKRLEEVLKKVKQYVDEVLVSDDGSTDNTAKIAKKSKVKLISSPVNMGVGHATRLGCEYAIEKLEADVIVLIDADGQHPPEEIPSLLKKLDEGYDFVFTNRFGDSKEMPLVKKIGNSMLTLFTELLAGIRISDSQCGFRALTSDSYKKLEMKTDGYTVCSEFVMEVGRKHIKYCEIQIKAVYDDWTKIKGTDVVSGLRVFVDMLYRRFS